MDVKFDIFRKLPDGQHEWMAAVAGLEKAKSELAEWVRVSPGDYFIYDARNGSVIAAERSAYFSIFSQKGDSF